MHAPASIEGLWRIMLSSSAAAAAAAALPFWLTQDLISCNFCNHAVLKLTKLTEACACCVPLHMHSARDIQSQLPVEAKAFMHVDKQLREIMRKTKDRPNALQVGVYLACSRLEEVCDARGQAAT
eukprot:1161956-Pelagomonas_calceolata.AAC.4